MGPKASHLPAAALRTLPSMPAVDVHRRCRDGSHLTDPGPRAYLRTPGRDFFRVRMTTLSSSSGEARDGVDGGFFMAGWLAAALMASAAPAAQAQTDFFNSFEADETAPTWESTAETDADGVKRMSGVTGSSTPGIPGNIRDRVTAVTASAENPPGETAERVNDGDVNSKWLAFEPTGWIRYELSEPVTVVRYALSSANDSAERDPRDWQLQGSHDGSAWTTVDTQSGQDFGERFQTKEYDVADPGCVRVLPAEHHRQPRRRPDPARRAPALRRRHHAAARHRHEGGRHLRPGQRPDDEAGGRLDRRPALRYSGGHTAEGRGYAYDKVFDVDLEVTRNSELSYLIFPELTNNDLGYPSTYAAVDLAFTDGTYLSELRALDQQEYDLDPQGQGATKSLYANQWNRKVSDIGAVARGKTIDRILVGYDNPKGTHLFNGWIDDIRIDGSPAKETPRAAVRLGAHHPRDQLDRRLQPRQQHPRHRRPARLQLLDADDRRRLDQLALRLPAGQQRRQPAADRGVHRLARAEPVDGRPPDVPGHAVAGHRRARGRPRRSRADLQARERDRQALPLRREVRERHAHRHRADRPRRAVPLRVHRRRGQRDPRQRRPGRRRLRPHHQRRPTARSAAGPTSPAGSPTAPAACSSTARSTRP